MSDPPHGVKHRRSPDSSPWSPAALARRAQEDMLDIARSMHARLRDVSEIYGALRRQAALWKQRGASLPDDLPLTTIRQLPALTSWTPSDSIAPERLADGVDPQQSYFWEMHTAEETRRIEAEALAWWDREMRVMRIKADAERQIRRLHRQPVCEDGQADIPHHAREIIAEIVREIVADELPEALRVLGLSGD